MKHSDEYSRILCCVHCIRQEIGDFTPDVAVILGSGLGAFADEIDVIAAMSYSEIEGFPVSTVSGHAGRLVFGRVGDVRVVLMQGRVHMYEGYTPVDTVLPVRVMRMLGAKAIILTNAAGGINRSFEVGDFMLIQDHVSLFVPSPLIGTNLDKLGDRFPNMNGVYSKQLSDSVETAAGELGITLRHGTYVQLTGPSYESLAEIKLLSGLNIDAVGMSTVCEAIAARHCGMMICGISCISNMAAGIVQNPPTHSEVKEIADRRAPEFISLLRASIVAIGKLISI